jgi:ornithine cyclodeaminase/alanine dehydrogenase-like protein (mu-crystallin family)
MLILSGDDVRRALPMREAIEAVRSAMAQLSAGQCVVPERAHVDVPDISGVALFMPSYAPAMSRMAVKVITLFDQNPGKGLPRVQAVVLLLDAANGTPLAMMDGGTLTAIRTGAGSGVATDMLARSDSRSVAVFGAGIQARAQLEAVACVRPIGLARVYDPDVELAERFSREMGARLGFPIEPAEDAAAAMADADIVCTATVSHTPVFDDGQVRPGMHINAIGSYKPHVQELPGATVARARLFVDYRKGALTEPGDLLIPMAEGLIGPEHIVGEIGEIALGRKQGRTSDDEITLYKSVGVAVQDLAAASAAYERAMALGLGMEARL